MVEATHWSGEPGTCLVCHNHSWEHPLWTGGSEPGGYWKGYKDGECTWLHTESASGQACVKLNVGGSCTSDTIFFTWATWMTNAGMDPTWRTRFCLLDFHFIRSVNKKLRVPDCKSHQNPQICYKKCNLFNFLQFLALFQLLHCLCKGAVTCHVFPLCAVKNCVTCASKTLCSCSSNEAFVYFLSVAGLF